MGFQAGQINMILKMPSKSMEKLRKFNLKIDMHLWYIFFDFKYNYGIIYIIYI